MRMLELLRVFLLITVTVAFVDAANENATAQIQGRSADSGNVPFKKSYWTKGKTTSWSFPALSTDVVTVKPGDQPATTVKAERSSGSLAASSVGGGGAFEKKSDSVLSSVTAKYPTAGSSDYYQELTSAITNIANFENARARDYSGRYYSQPVRSVANQAATNGPRIVDIVMHDAYRTPRRAKPQAGPSSDQDRYYGQESGRASYYYEPTAKKNDKFDNMNSNHHRAEKNRRYDYDYDSREVDGPHSDRRDDHWDHDWEDYHYDHHKYYDHKHHHKKDYDYLLPLLLLILAPLAVSSFLMPVTATLMTNSMYFAGAQGAIYQGRKKRSIDARQDHRNLLIELVKLLEEAAARFDANERHSSQAKRKSKTR